MSGDEIRALQIRLNRISTNYPAIPKIVNANGIFSYDTEDAVIAFQEIFGLVPDGIVGKSTWYAIQYIYNSVARLNELDSEGIRYEEIADLFPSVLRPGDSGENVKYFQFILNYLSAFYDSIPPISVNGIFGEETEGAVKAAQTTFGITNDGIVGSDTWNAIYNAYLGIVKTVPLEFIEGNTVPYQGVVLTVGSDSDEVVLLQQYINFIANTYTDIPQIPVTGYYGTRTRESVVAFQRRFGLPVTGNVNGITWDSITREYRTLYNGALMSDGQYSGHILGGE
jgi:peptidoglycan hydrolase-like protein with peptidoglycan-binding domain